jgi:hypothetical protein
MVVFHSYVRLAKDTQLPSTKRLVGPILVTYDMSNPINPGRNEKAAAGMMLFGPLLR